MSSASRITPFRLGFAAGLVCCGLALAGLFYLSGPSDAAHVPSASQPIEPPRERSPRADIEIQLALNVVDEVAIGTQEDLAATLKLDMVENLFLHALSDSGRVVRTHKVCKGNSTAKLSYFVTVFPATPETVYFQITRVLDAPGKQDTTFEVRGPANIARLKEDLYEDASRWAETCADAIATRDRSPLQIVSPEEQGDHDLASTIR